MLCIWGPRLRGCVQTEQPIRAHFTFGRATRSPPPGQLTADSGATPPEEVRLFLASPPPKGQQATACSTQRAPAACPSRLPGNGGCP